jgi:poly-gamma-glutamate synthesis protein (capsule biosynthesis protein)
MKKQAVFIILLISLVSTCLFAQKQQSKSVVVENFDSGEINLSSYENEDNNSESWELSSSTTYNNSAYSLKLFGDTWKIEQIQQINVDTGNVWQIAAYIDNVADKQGFGITDGQNILFYSFAGNKKITDENWVTVYQGCFANKQWNIYKLPVADDWLRVFGALPKITGIVYVNDNSNSSQGIVYFDDVVDISQDLSCVPVVTISYTTENVNKTKGVKSVDVNFTSSVEDEDSNEHTYLWNFGDGTTSTQQNPKHIFTVTDNYSYTVLLQVTDNSGKVGTASCKIEIEHSDESTFPVTLNFVGDIMLARHFEEYGGIIPTQGVNAIFEPTRTYLKDSADITVANLECSFTTQTEQHPTKTICFKSSPQNISGLSYAGVDVVTIANNHIMDFLYVGMQETQSVLKEQGIVYSGAGANSYEASLPLFYTKKGVNFAFLASSDRTGQYNNYQPYLNAGYNKPGFAELNKYNIKKQINDVSDISDLIIMEWHCGSEYSIEPQKSHKNLEYVDVEEDIFPLLAPKQEDISIRHFAVDNGADLVICHHPHIIQGIELYKGKLIAHSLGNFVFDLYYLETFPSMILNVKADKNKFYEFTIIPVYIDGYIPKIARGELGLFLLDDIAKRSKDLNTYLKVDRNRVVATVITDTLNMKIDSKEISVQQTFYQSESNKITNQFLLDKSGYISSVNQTQASGNNKFRLGKELIWFGNMEDEGCSMWNFDSNSEKYCDTAFYKGKRSIQHTVSSSAFYGIKTKLKHKIICRSNTMKYSLSGYIKTINGKDVTIVVKYYNSRNAYYPLSEENVGVTVNSNTPWTFYSKQLTVPQGTKFFDIELVSGIPSNSTAYSWFDNVSLICWDSWEKYHTGSNIPYPNNYYYMQVKTSGNDNNIDIKYTVTSFEQITSDIDENRAENPLISDDINIYPNPFNPYNEQVRIKFNLNKKEKVTVSIYNINGQKIKITANNFFPKGYNIITWNGTSDNKSIVNPGIYFIKIETQNDSKVIKCVINYRF